MNRTVGSILAVGGVLLLMQAGCRKQSVDSPPAKARVTILAAASLRECIDEMVSESGLADVAQFDISTGASSSLAQQIQSGAKADLFLSANGEWAQSVVEQFPAAEKKIVAENTLVLIAPSDRGGELQSLDELARNPEWRIGIAGPEVPAGKYARQALASAGVLDGLIQNNRLIIGQDVRQVLKWVELGEVDAGLVYRTDIGIAVSVRKMLDIDPKTHDPVEYWMVSLNSQDDSNEPATKLYKWFSSERAHNIFGNRGFLAPQ